MPLSCLRTVFVNSFPLSHPLEAPSPDAFPVAEESQRSDRRRYTLTLPRLKKVQLIYVESKSNLKKQRKEKNVVSTPVVVLLFKGECRGGRHTAAAENS